MERNKKHFQKKEMIRVITRCDDDHISSSVEIRHMHPGRYLSEE